MSGGERQRSQSDAILMGDQTMNDRELKITVNAQVKAAELQAAYRWGTKDQFFSRMVGHMGSVMGADVAAHVVTIFEIVAAEHEEMMDAAMTVGGRSAPSEAASQWDGRRQTGVSKKV